MFGIWMTQFKCWFVNRDGEDVVFDTQAQAQEFANHYDLINYEIKERDLNA